MEMETRFRTYYSDLSAFETVASSAWREERQQFNYDIALYEWCTETK